VVLPAPQLGTRVARPPVREDHEVVDPSLVVTEVVFGAAVDEHVARRREEGAAVVVVNGREEVAEVAVPRGPVHDQVRADVGPLGHRGRRAVGALVDVGRAVPGVDRAVVLGLPHPVEQQVAPDAVAVAEGIVDVDPGSGAVVRDVVLEGGPAGGGGEQRRTLLAGDADLVEVALGDRGPERAPVGRDAVVEVQIADRGDRRVADERELAPGDVGAPGLARQEHAVPADPDERARVHRDVLGPGEEERPAAVDGPVPG